MFFNTDESNIETQIIHVSKNVNTNLNNSPHSFRLFITILALGHRIRANLILPQAHIFIIHFVMISALSNPLVYPLIA